MRYSTIRYHSRSQRKHHILDPYRTDSPSGPNVKVIFGKRANNAYEALHYEHHQIFGSTSDILVASFGARSRITPTIISESTISTNQDCIKTSAAIIALAIDELAVATLANRRGNLATPEDGFTCDLEHLAQFCAVAEPFDFDIKNF
jgi:hypothetical protein